MKNKTEWIKQYDADYCDILESIAGESMSKRQINRKIAKKWKVPYSVIKDLSNESDNINNELRNATKR